MPKTLSSKFTRPTTGPYELKKRVCKECCELIPFGGPCPKSGCKAKVDDAAAKWVDQVLEVKEEEVKESKPNKFFFLKPKSCKTCKRELRPRAKCQEKECKARDELEKFAFYCYQAKDPKAKSVASKKCEEVADKVLAILNKTETYATPAELTQCMPSLAPRTMPTALTALAMVSRVMNSEVTKVAKQHLAEERFKLSYEEDFSFKGLLCKVMMFRNWGNRACRLYLSDNAQPTFAMPVRGEPLTDNMIRAFRVRGYHVMIPDRHSAAAMDDHLMAIISFERGLPARGSFTTYGPLGPLEPMQPTSFEHLDFGGLRRDDDEEDEEEDEGDEEA
jgi:hypothetical protein